MHPFNLCKWVAEFVAVVEYGLFKNMYIKMVYKHVIMDNLNNGKLDMTLTILCFGGI